MAEAVARERAEVADSVSQADAVRFEAARGAAVRAATRADQAAETARAREQAARTEADAAEAEAAQARRAMKAIPSGQLREVPDSVRRALVELANANLALTASNLHLRSALGEQRSVIDSLTRAQTLLLAALGEARTTIAEKTQAVAAFKRLGRPRTGLWSRLGCLVGAGVTESGGRVYAGPQAACGIRVTP